MNQSNKVEEGISVANNKLKFYVITTTKDAVGEDGKSGHAGYAVTNKDTGVVEHTTTILPGVLFQAQHLDDMLVSLFAAPEENNAEEGESAITALSEDTVLN